MMASTQSSADRQTRQVREFRVSELGTMPACFSLSAVGTPTAAVSRPLRAAAERDEITRVLSAGNPGVAWKPEANPAMDVWMRLQAAPSSPAFTLPHFTDCRVQPLPIAASCTPQDAECRSGWPPDTWAHQVAPSIWRRAQVDWPLSAESRRRHPSRSEKELSGEGEWEALSRAEMVLAPLWLRLKLLVVQSSERMNRPAAGVGSPSAGSRNPELAIGNLNRRQGDSWLCKMYQVWEGTRLSLNGSIISADLRKLFQRVSCDQFRL